MTTEQDLGKLIDWAKEIDATLIVTDANNIVIHVNEAACEVFKATKLVGTELIAHHPKWAIPAVEELLDKKKPDCYTTETPQGKHFVYHTPWFKDGEYAGFVELVIPIRKDMRNIIRGDFKNK